MPQLIDDATRIRVIRALVGMTTAQFAQRLAVRPDAVTQWEHGRLSPRTANQQRLRELCCERGIAILPCGMPVPYYAVLTLKEHTNGTGKGIGCTV